MVLGHHEGRALTSRQSYLMLGRPYQVNGESIIRQRYIDDGVQMALNVKPGQRLLCGSCGTQVVIVKVPAVELSCCGTPMQLPTAQSQPSAEN
jgi:hypothetical protein